MDKTTPRATPAPSNGDYKLPSFAEMVEQDRLERERAKAAAKQPEPIAETVTRLVAENKLGRKLVTAKQYGQATKLQVGSEVFNMGLTNNELVVWFYLVRCSDKHGKCFPSISAICEHCQCRRSTAVKSIRTLEQKNIISSHHRHHKPTVYMQRPPQDWSSLTVNASKEIPL
jgi:helix-turn-helix protein